MIAKVSKTKSWFFVNINKIDKSSARPRKEKKRGLSSNKLNYKLKKERLQWTPQKYKGS